MYNYAYKYAMKFLDLSRPLFFHAKCLPFDPSQAASSLVGGVMNLISTNKTNKANAKLAAQQNQWNIEQWNREADFTREMWNANNEYNDPSAQMERLTNAGLSPWAAAQVLGAGDAQSVSAPSGQASAGYQNQAADYSFIGEAAKAAFDSYVRNKQLGVELRAAEQDAQLKDEQIAQAKIKTAIDAQYGLATAQSTLNNLLHDEKSKQYSTALSMQALENNATMFSLQQDYQRRQNTLLDRSISEQEIRNSMLVIQKAAEELRLENLPKQLAADLALSAAQTYAAIEAGNLSKQEIQNRIAEKLETEARAAGIKDANKLAKRIANYQVHKARSEAYQAENDRYGKYVGFGRGIGNYVMDLWNSARNKASANNVYRHAVELKNFNDELKYHAVYGY